MQGNQVNFYSFKDWCLDSGNCDLLSLWDYEKNEVSPEEIGHMSRKYVWFKCERDLHGSSKAILEAVTKARNVGKSYRYCHGCYSIGQHILDNYGKEYLDSIWSEKNEGDPFEIAKGTGKKIWLKCTNNESHPDYDVTGVNFARSHKCPYCSGRRVCHDNALGTLRPEAINVWSNKNDKTPYDYTQGSDSYVWWKCENGVHEDYSRTISNASNYDFKCPKCASENRVYVHGENHPCWKGGVTTEAQAMRKSPEYADWRTRVYEKDGYICQCCGVKGRRLTAHHLLDYANHPDLRFDVNNGITLCFNCHDSTVQGSFHNTYGTHGKTKEELEDFVNNKRKELGLLIPFSINDYVNGKTLREEDIIAYLYYSSIWKLIPCSRIQNKTSNLIKIRPRFSA